MQKFLIMKKTVLILIGIIGFGLSAISQNDCNCDNVKKSIEIYKKQYNITVKENNVYLTQKLCNGGGGSVFSAANYCMVELSFSSMEACQNWINQNGKKYNQQNSGPLKGSYCFKCIQCNGSGTSSSSNSNSYNNSNSPLIPFSTGNGTGDAIVGGAIAVASVTYLLTETIVKKHFENKLKSIENRQREIDEEIAREKIEKQNIIEEKNLKNPNIYFPQNYIAKDGCDLLTEIGLEHKPEPLIFEDYIPCALWEKDLRDMSEEELSTFIREYNRFWKDYQGADGLNLISDEIKKELTDMGIDFAAIFIAEGVEAATSILATPFGGLVINAIAQPIISAIAESAKAINNGKSVTDPTVSKQIIQSAAKSLISQVNAESNLANIAMKITTDIVTSENNSLSHIASQGIKIVGKTWGASVIDMHCDGCSDVLIPLFEFVDEITPNVELKNLKR